MSAVHEVPRKMNRYPHLAKEPLIVGTNGPNFNNRLWAKLIDFSLIHIACAFFNWIWAPSLIIAELVLWALIDGSGKGQSPGKWLLGLHTIESSRGKPIGAYHGIIRNLPFALISTALLWDSKFAYFLMVLCFLVLLMETFFIYRLKTGVRVGDVVSNTRVFDYKDEHTLFIERFLKDDTQG